MRSDEDIQKLLKGIVADAVTNITEDQFTSMQADAIADYAEQKLKRRSGEKVDKWFILRVEIATLCLTFSRIGVVDAAGLLHNLLKDMERYEMFENLGKLDTL